MYLEEQIRQAIARGWCHETNSHKEMDTDLAEAIFQELMASFTMKKEPEPDVPAYPAEPTLDEYNPPLYVVYPRDPRVMSHQPMDKCWMARTPHGWIIGTDPDRVDAMAQRAKVDYNLHRGLQTLS